MKTLLLFGLAGWLIYGCNGQASTPALNTAHISAPIIAAPVLSSGEIRHYRTTISSFIDSIYRHRPLNGSILVAKEGEVVYETYSGFRNPSSHTDSISSSTPFHLASISKTFTAMAIMKLQENGKLNIENPVSAYLPKFPLEGVTIKTLLNHRSGIPNYVHYMEVLGWDRKKQMTNQDILDFIIKRKKDIQIGAPDKRFSYSNTNYALLALVIEKVSGQPFPDFMRRTFFEPLGMKDTYVFTMADSARFLQSYFSNGRQYAFDYLDQVYGDKNIYSTVRDMLKWDQALYAGTFFSQQTLDSTFKGYSFEKPGVNNYGLGWRMFDLKNDKKFVYHNGWWHGNRTAFYRMPDDKVTIIAFTNNDSKRIYSCKKIADMFGNYFKVPEEEMASENENLPDSSSKP